MRMYTEWGVRDRRLIVQGARSGECALERTRQAIARREREGKWGIQRESTGELKIGIQHNSVSERRVKKGNPRDEKQTARTKAKSKNREIQHRLYRARADEPTPTEHRHSRQTCSRARSEAKSRVKGSTSARVESSPWRGGIWGARFLATHILPNTSPASSEPGVMPGGLGVCAPAALYGVLVPLKFE